MTATCVSSRDPLLYEVPLPVRQRFHPLGFPVDLFTNAEEIRLAAEEAWAPCTPAFAVPPLQLRLILDGQASSDRPPAMRPRAQGNLFSMVHSSGNYCVADLTTGFAYGWFTPSVLADRGHFRYHFLEPVTYVMLNNLYLAPIHAACVGWRGSGVVLCGPSGAGKTSLAFSCARKGWQFVCDDASHLVRMDEDARWIAGKPHQIRFRESARSLFPELAHREPSRRANGKMDIESPTAELGVEHLQPHIRASVIVFLNRKNEGSARLGPFSKEEAREFLYETVCVGEEPARQAQRQCLDRFLELPVFQLTYSRLDEAECCLRSLVEQGEI